MEEPTEQLQITFERHPNNYQPNAITEGRQEFSEMEKKIVVLAINQLRLVARTWKPGQNVVLLVPFAELTEHHHGKIAAAASTLNTKRIGYQDLSNPKDIKFDYITPFPRVRSTKLDGKSYLELVMFADVVPGFIELGKRYTSYSIQLMLSLSSTYAQRMYEIIMMFYGRGQKEFTYEVSKLRMALNYPIDHDYYDFKRKALMVAQQEMQQKIDFHFEFIPSRKEGKAVIELRFEVKSGQDLINEDIEQDLSTARAMQPHEIAAVARNLIYQYKFTKKQQSQILEDFTLMDTFIRIHAELLYGKRVVKNPTAYMAQSLGFGKALPKSASATEQLAKARRSRETRSVNSIMTDIIEQQKA